MSQERWEFRADSESHKTEPGNLQTTETKAGGNAGWDGSFQANTWGSFDTPHVHISLSRWVRCGWDSQNLGPIFSNIKLSTDAKQMCPLFSWITASWNCYRRLTALPSLTPFLLRSPGTPSRAGFQSTFPLPGSSEVNKAISSCPLWWASPDLWPMDLGI